MHVWMWFFYSEVVKKGVHYLGIKLGIISSPSLVSPKLDEEDPLDALYKKTVVSSSIC